MFASHSGFYNILQSRCLLDAV